MRLVTVLFVTLLILAALLFADVETAAFFLSRAESELNSGRLDEAEAFIERSLSEEVGFLPAIVMKARLAQRRGNRAEAIRHLEFVLAKKSSARGAIEGRAIRDAEDLMKKLDSARGDYSKLMTDYVAKLLSLARASERRKPKLAAACYQQILAVQPDHAEAKKKFKASAVASKVAKKAKAAPRGEDVFNGENLNGWSGSAPSWTVKDKIMRARLDGVAQLNLLQDRVRDDYEFICELRFVETMGKDPLVGLLFGGLGKYDHFGLWVWEDNVRLERQTEENRRSSLARKNTANLPGKFSRSDWHVYRIVHKDKRITVFIDGKEVFSYAGADRKAEGFVGIWGQDSLIEIRRVAISR